MRINTLARASAVWLFCVTIATIALMWQPAFWATAIAEALSCILAAVWLVTFIAGVEGVRFRLVLVPLAVAALWPTMQILAGGTAYPWMTSVVALYWVTGAAVVFTGLQVFSDSGLRLLYLRALVFVGFFMAVIAPLQLFTAEGKIFWLFESEYGRSAMGPFVYANQYAAFIELLLPIALTQLFSDRSGWRTFYGLSAAVMYASVLASASRTGFILTTLEMLIVPLLAAKRTGTPWRRALTSGAVFLGALIVLGLAVGPEKLATKFEQKNPYAGRQEYLQSSLRMIRDRPLTGFGLGNWPTAYPAYTVFDDGFFANQAHNDWAQWAVEGGVPFFLLILLVAIWSVRAAFRSGWGIGVAVVLLQCLVDYPIQRMGVAIVFFTLLAAIAYSDDPLSDSRRNVP